MNPEQKLLDKIGRTHGLTVPDSDFLCQVYIRVSQQLPEKKAPQQKKRTPWQIMRPYVYLAAMFAGLWLTMRIVTSLTVAPQQPVSLDNPPVLVAQAMSTPEVAEQINLASKVPEVSIVADAAADYSNMDEFEEAFDYELDPSIEKLDVAAIANADGKSEADDISVYDLYEFAYYDDYYNTL